VLRNNSRLLALAVREARPVVQAIFLLRFFCGLVLAGPPASVARPAVVAAAGAWYCATLAVYLYNGVTDVVEDTANQSPRPIASGRLRPDTARRQVAGFAFAAMVLSWISGGMEPLLTAGFLGLGYLYSGGPLPLKRTAPGVMAVAVLGSMLTYLAGYFGADWPPAPGRNFVFVVCMTLWMSCVGLTKEFSDSFGDALAGRRTGCLAWGDRRMRTLICLLAVLIGVGFLAAALRIAPALVPSAAAVSAGALAVAVATLRGAGRGDRRRLRRPYRAFMATQYGAHLILLVRMTLPAFL
jgi:4-hydroxybenzoate polyprenyltransferase